MLFTFFNTKKRAKEFKLCTFVLVYIYIISYIYGDGSISIEQLYAYCINLFAKLEINFSICYRYDLLHRSKTFKFN